MSETQRSSDPAEVVVVGGGVAALEALMALRAHAGDGLGITLVAPQAEFVYRPMLVAEPFDLGSLRRYPLQQVASDFGARVLHGAVTAVDAAERRVILRSGATVGYDTLILAPGARMLGAFDAAIAFGEPDSGGAMRGLLADIEEGRAHRVAFVAPTS